MVVVCTNVMVRYHDGYRSCIAAMSVAPSAIFGDGSTRGALCGGGPGAAEGVGVAELACGWQPITNNNPATSRRGVVKRSPPASVIARPLGAAHLRSEFPRIRSIMLAH